MKQFQFSFRDSETFCNELQEFKTRCDAEKRDKLFFQIYSEVLEEDVVSEVCDAIRQYFPDVPYMGCSTSGNIVDCQVSSEITVVCTVFELASTQLKLFQYDLSAHPVDYITNQIVEESRKNAWVKAIEMFFTIPEGSTTAFCDGLKDVREDVQMFGAVSCSNDITSDACCVFSKEGKFSKSSVIIVFYGGEDFYVDSMKITGWKSLGREFHVTKSDGSILFELDGVKAYDVYHKYLNINNDENFFFNTLEFPLFYEHNDTTILRVPVASNEDGSIAMSSDIDVGSVVSISYGDPETIVREIEEAGRKIRAFQPDVLHIFSCAARKAFWAKEEPTYEIYPLREISSAAGFFSHGEFVRAKGNLNQHNVTLVLASMREGEKTEKEVPNLPIENQSMSKIPLVARLATFISVTSMELEQTNRQLELLNEKLQRAVIVDGLTGLFNRKEIQRRIEEKLKEREKVFSLIMLDIDNFKLVNDTYGHQQGDMVIITLAAILHNEKLFYNDKFSAGRWGGEEFMLLLDGTDISAASFIAELIRQCFENTTYPEMRSQTVSIGVTQVKEDDSIDSICTRVDAALYSAKKDGKNRVVVV